MKRFWIIMVLILLVLTACGAPQDTPDAVATGQPEAADGVIWASGKLTPVRWAGLSPALSGTVTAIHVKEETRSPAGDLLIDLDNGVMKSQVDAAAAAVAEAEAALAKLMAAATAAQTAQADAGLAAARAGLALAESEEAQVQQAVRGAEAQVAIAQAQYNDLAAIRTDVLRTDRPCERGHGPSIES